jgi:hypothetical protein
MDGRKPNAADQKRGVKKVGVQCEGTERTQDGSKEDQKEETLRNIVKKKMPNSIDKRSRKAAFEHQVEGRGVVTPRTIKSSVVGELN